MKANASIRDDYAVSEIVGGIILVLIAVISFAAIYAFLMPGSPDTTAHTKLVGYVTDDGIIVLEHIGGNSIDSYTIEMRYTSNYTLIEKNTYEDHNWKIGMTLSPFTTKSIDEFDNKVLVRVTASENGKSETLFEGILTGKAKEIIPLNMLVSSLLTNTVDEDLLCFNYSIAPNIDAETFIYNWLLNGVPFAEYIWSFDVNDATDVKDYSGNGNNGTISSATWASDGVIGGCYEFDGAGDSIEADDVPAMFLDISRGDCTISLWVKSYDVTDDGNVLFEVCDNYPGYKSWIRIFQYESEIHMCVLEDTTPYVAKTYESLTDNQWYHIACTWDATTKEVAIYLNGIKSTESGFRNVSFGSQDGFSLGHGSASSPYWYGQMDELQIFDKVLSDDQIYQIYMCQKDGESNVMIIVSDETEVDDIWSCIVTPSNSDGDDSPVTSNEITVVEYGGG